MWPTRLEQLQQRFAVAQTPVENLTLLASAGLDRSTSHVGDLQVDPKRLWATQSVGDSVAFWGRIAEHPINPTATAFGAQLFSSEEASTEAGQLHGSDGHSAAPQVEAALHGQRETEYGYLDQFTNPLRTTALTSLGMGHQVSAITASQLQTPVPRERRSGLRVDQILTNMFGER